MATTITLARVRPFGYTITADDGRDILVQLDYDYPGVASTFGWSIRDVAPRGCDHEWTDGTITCLRCDTPPSTFIAAAAAWLDEHDGATAEDPGYFAAEDPAAAREWLNANGWGEAGYLEPGREAEMIDEYRRLSAAAD